ncbi:DMT family transporter [Acetobacter tropicalis]|uniref:Small multidrug resistance protein n=4 Tax=Acetobacter TaxID=434 RepID=A0A0U5EZH6_9PROT|nr:MULTISPECIES: SMR family transporter [Acetobacter]CEF42470.1 small multidrug resistance protein [Acetobacter senegalensis]
MNPGCCVYKMLGYFYIFMTVVSEVVATAAQKETLDFTRILPTIIMVAGYVSSFVFLALSLRLVPMGIVYAGSAGLSIVLANLAGWIYFRDQLGGHQAAGIVLILLGISIIAAPP